MAKFLAACYHARVAHFAIKAPSRTAGKGKRRTFAIQEVDDKGRRTLTLEALDAVNKQLLAGDIDRPEALKQVRALRDQLYRDRDKHAGKPVFASENLQLLDRYWDAEYEHREVIDEDTIRWDLQRAVESVGLLSLLVATRQQLQDELAKRFVGKSEKHRRVASRLNQLLKFAGRDFTLRKPKPTRKLVRHLTLEQFLQVLPRLRSPQFRALAEVAFYTGLRAGEVFALTEAAIRADHLYVDAQVDEALERRDTKTRAARKVWIIESGLDAVRRWLAVPASERDKLRIVRHATVFRRACKRAFKDRPELHCRFHDLRHSYAIYLVSRGVPLTLVAQSLGNGVSVCEKYYSGFVLTDLSMQLMSKLLK